MSIMVRRGTELFLELHLFRPISPQTLIASLQAMGFSPILFEVGELSGFGAVRRPPVAPPKTGLRRKTFLAAAAKYAPPAPTPAPAPRASAATPRRTVAVPSATPKKRIALNLAQKAAIAQAQNDPLAAWRALHGGAAAATPATPAAAAAAAAPLAADQTAPAASTSAAAPMGASSDQGAPSSPGSAPSTSSPSYDTSAYPSSAPTGGGGGGGGGDTGPSSPGPSPDDGSTMGPAPEAPSEPQTVDASTYAAAPDTTTYTTEAATAPEAPPPSIALTTAEIADMVNRALTQGVEIPSIAGLSDGIFRFVAVAQRDMLLENTPYGEWTLAWPLHLSALSPIHVTPQALRFERGQIYEARLLSTSASPNHVRATLEQMGFDITQGPFMIRKNIRHPSLQGSLSEWIVRGRWQNKDAALPGAAYRSILFEELATGS